MRIPGIDPADAAPELARYFQAQIESFGAPFQSSLVAARRPTIFLGLQALGKGIEESGLLPGELKALVCRRVASHNDCPF